MKSAKYLLAGAVVFLALGMTTTTVAQQSESPEYNVTISETTELDVTPSQLHFTGLEPGQKNMTSDDGFYAVEVENMGSTDIDQIWAEATKPTTLPFGTGDSTNYDAGNFLQLYTANTSTDASVTSLNEPLYVNRVEYSEDAPSYLQIEDPSNVDSSFNETEVGRFRKGDQELWYVIFYDDGGAGGECDGSASSNAVMRYADTVRTPTQTGTFDFTNDGSDYTEVTIQEVSGVDFYGAVPGEELFISGESYDILTYCSGSGGSEDSHTVRTRFNVNVESPGGTSSATDTTGLTGSAAQYILDASSSSNMLRPGQSFLMDVDVEVPLGVPQGEVTEGTLTVNANADTG